MVIKYIDKFLNPIWTDFKSFDLLIEANFFYPIHQKTNNKLIHGIIFYMIFAFYAPNYLSHGFFFNFYANSWPTLAKIFSYHLDTPYLFKIAKIMFSIGSFEVIYFRFYFAFLYFKRYENLKKLLRFDPYFDSNLKVKVLKMTKMSCTNISVLSFFVTLATYNYGFIEKDTIGKVFSIICSITSIHIVRYVSSDIYILIFYVILIVDTIRKSCSTIIIMFYGKNLNMLQEESINKFLKKYISIVTMINDSNNIIATISMTGKMLAIPMMSFTWFMSFETPDTFFLSIFKWLAFSLCSTYAVKAYVLTGYLSLVHSKSKQLYNILNSIMARSIFRNNSNEDVGKRKLLLFIIENISGRMNQMSYKDSYDGIIEQKDTFRSISITFEFIILLMTFSYRNRN